jgi:hypothetical protein
MDLDVVLVSETENEWKYRVTLQSGGVRYVTASERDSLNRRETNYTLRLEDGRIWEVVILSMPNRRYA